MKNKKQKPTLKEVVGEVNYLGGRLIQLENVVRNTVVVIEKYIKFKGDHDIFKKSLEDEAGKGKSVKDVLDKQSSSKKTKPKKSFVFKIINYLRKDND